MLRRLLDHATIALLLGLALIAALAVVEPPQPKIVIEANWHPADFPVCVTVRPGPLEHSHGANLYPRRSDNA